LSKTENLADVPTQNAMLRWFELKDAYLRNFALDLVSAVVVPVPQVKLKRWDLLKMQQQV
jgi:hypothetical protein